jgi:FkbM family methyltransferase
MRRALNIFERALTNISDIATFGPAFLWRHSPRVTGACTAAVLIPGFGRIHVRAGESDVAAVRQVFGQRQYDIGLLSVGERIDRRYANILQSGRTPVIVDAGANIGAASLWLAKKYPAAIVVAIEPEHGNFQVLNKNADSEPRIKAVHAAVGSTQGFVQLENVGLGWATRTVRGNEGVPVITMKDAFNSVENGTPFIAKVDIEGFESDLFSQSVEWLSDVYVVFIEPHDWLLPGKMTSHTFQRAMGDHDFEIFISGENLTYVRC